MPTLQDVARRAGVSTATVSKVLSNTPYFTEATRAKVMQAVEELGYKPNLAARALASGKTRIIAVVFPYVYEAFFTDPLTLRILAGIEEECTRMRYNMLLSTPRVTEAGPEEHYLQLIESGYLEGVLAIDNVPIASVMQPACERNLPGVTIGYHEADYYVRSDDFSGGQMLMRHILELGHRRIGVLTVPEEMHFSIGQRLKGMQTAATEAGVDFPGLPVCPGDFSVASGERGAATLLDQHPDLTAIICLNDRMAMGAVQAARASGREVPADLTVVGYDNIPAAATFSPPLTTIDQRAPELGRQAARMLFDLLQGATPQSAQLPVELVMGGSSADVKNHL